jgi:hypothetical protein
MRSALLAGLIIAGLTASTAHAADKNYHELVLDLPLPSRIEQAVHHSREETRGDATQSMWVDTRSQVTLDANEAGDAHRVTLKLLERKVSSPELEPMLAATVPATMVYEADESLRPTKIEDWDQIKVQQLSFVAKAMPALKAPMEKMYASLSPETAAAMMLKEQAYLSVGQNIGVTLGAPTLYDIESPSPFGGAPIKLKGQISLESFDDKAKVATVRWTEKPDPESTMAAGLKLAGQLAGPEKSTEIAKAAEAMRSVKMDITKGCLFEIDTVNGLVRKADCEETIVATDGTGGPNGSSKRSERWVMTQTVLKN